MKIEIKDELLAKLAWSLAIGTDEQRVEFVILEAISNAEKEEGIIYPSERLPGHDFDGMTLKE